MVWALPMAKVKATKVSKVRSLTMLRTTAVTSPDMTTLCVPIRKARLKAIVPKGLAAAWEVKAMVHKASAAAWEVKATVPKASAVAWEAKATVPKVSAAA
ncbi:hypothetical protein ERICIV_02893 [Paenibacillus larvae subsp. larvae]|uniref:Uncharacterized protein n=2 Tax=Paenibacillus larvae TaxID=1464 RepID=A0A2L1UFR6_9BACL|nr:hypothetical protein ERICIII_02902 [Paenibacillus larvae subsp. larvae]AVF31780.1 hypothetical protein ERICIV_02893 [Paenibacillus larvae subsp. larvae]